MCGLPRHVCDARAMSGSSLDGPSLLVRNLQDARGSLVWLPLVVDVLALWCACLLAGGPRLHAAPTVRAQGSQRRRWGGLGMAPRAGGSATAGVTSAVILSPLAFPHCRLETASAARCACARPGTSGR
eukprot:8315660-Pyramimonas_sp.AAC.1